MHGSTTNKVQWDVNHGITGTALYNDEMAANAAESALGLAETSYDNAVAIEDQMLAQVQYNLPSGSAAYQTLQSYLGIMSSTFAPTYEGPMGIVQQDPSTGILYSPSYTAETPYWNSGYGLWLSTNNPPTS